MCIILKIDLSCCCKGCRKKMFKKLQHIAGVEQVKGGDDEATIMVCGKGFDEAEILRQVKKRKSRSEVEVVSRIGHNVSNPLHDMDAGGRSVNAEGVQPQPKLKPKPKPELKPEVTMPEPEPEPEPELKLKPKPESKPEVTEPELKRKLRPRPEPEPRGDNVEEEHRQEEESNSPRKVDTLVTERTFEFQGTKIRTRVTTSQDGCTCIRVEETHFIINKYGHSAHESQPFTSPQPLSLCESQTSQISDV